MIIDIKQNISIVKGMDDIFNKLLTIGLLVLVNRVKWELILFSCVELVYIYIFKRNIMWDAT